MEEWQIYPGLIRIKNISFCRSIYFSADIKMASQRELHDRDRSVILRSPINGHISMWVHFSTSCLLSRVSLSVENVVQPGVSLQKSLSIVVLAVVLLNFFSKRNLTKWNVIITGDFYAFIVCAIGWESSDDSFQFCSRALRLLLCKSIWNTYFQDWTL